MLQDDSTAEQTYELYGPTEYSMQEISDIAAKEVLKRKPLINIPKRIRKPMTAVMSRLLWFIESNPDMIEREFINQTIDPTAKTFRDLGIEPSVCRDVCMPPLSSSSRLTQYVAGTESVHIRIPPRIPFECKLLESLPTHSPLLTIS